MDTFIGGGAGSKDAGVTGSAAAEDYLKSVTNLPSNPALLVELLAVLKQPEMDLDRVLDLVGYDPGLTAELLRRSNSVAFSCEQPVVDVAEAITRMGFYQTYCILVAYLGGKFSALAGMQDALDLKEFWRHSALTAVTTSVLAEAAGESKSAGFISGLLHDVGKLIFAASEPGRYGAVLRDRAAHGPFPPMRFLLSRS